MATTLLALLKAKLILGAISIDLFVANIDPLATSIDLATSDSKIGENFIELGGAVAIAIVDENSVLAEAIELAASFHCAKLPAIVFHSQRRKCRVHVADYFEAPPHTDRHSDTRTYPHRSLHSAETPLRIAFHWRK